MNTLAHFSLGYPDPELMLGQFLGDFTKGAIKDLPFSTRVKMGIRAHRSVDAGGDQHAFTRIAKRWLPSHQRRYVGIVLDVYTDYLLTQCWEDLMDKPFRVVVGDIHGVLQNPPEDLPRSAERFASALLDYSLLESYQDPFQLPEILDRIGSRLRRPVRLSEIVEVLHQHEDELLDLFPGYFQDMKKLALQSS